MKNKKDRCVCYFRNERPTASYDNGYATVNKIKAR